MKITERILSDLDLENKYKFNQVNSLLSGNFRISYAKYSENLFKIFDLGQNQNSKCIIEETDECLLQQYKLENERNLM